MNPVKDYHVSANNPYISHQGPRDTCQFRDCIAHRMRYVILAETTSPPDDVIRVQEWLNRVPTDAELHMARLVARDRDQRWATDLLDHQRPEGASE